jgi:hypothetical protein
MGCGICEMKDAEILRMRIELDFLNHRSCSELTAAQEGKIRELRLRAIGVAAQLESLTTHCSLSGNPLYLGTGDDLKRLARQLRTEDEETEADD